MARQPWRQDYRQTPTGTGLGSTPELWAGILESLPALLAGLVAILLFIGLFTVFAIGVVAILLAKSKRPIITTENFFLALLQSVVAGAALSAAVYLGSVAANMLLFGDFSDFSFRLLDDPFFDSLNGFIVIFLFEASVSLFFMNRLYRAGLTQTYVFRAIGAFGIMAIYISGNVYFILREQSTAGLFEVVFRELWSVVTFPVQIVEYVIVVIRHDFDWNLIWFSAISLWQGVVARVEITQGNLFHLSKDYPEFFFVVGLIMLVFTFFRGLGNVLGINTPEG